MPGAITKFNVNSKDHWILEGEKWTCNVCETQWLVDKNDNKSPLGRPFPN